MFVRGMSIFLLNEDGFFRIILQPLRDTFPSASTTKYPQPFGHQSQSPSNPSPFFHYAHNASTTPLTIVDPRSLPPFTPPYFLINFPTPLRISARSSITPRIGCQINPVSARHPRPSRSRKPTASYCSSATTAIDQRAPSARSTFPIRCMQTSQLSSNPGGGAELRTRREQYPPLCPSAHSSPSTTTVSPHQPLSRVTTASAQLPSSPHKQHHLIRLRVEGLFGEQRSLVEHERHLRLWQVGRLR